ncbi:MAG: hypothetical protein RBQ99_07900 [Trichlorobacter sp.]|nr:hypothetical protein [Trichlorobacter sp.]
MQITINTADLLGDETTIRDEVIEQISNALLLRLRETVTEQVTNIIQEQLAQQVKFVISDLVNLHLDTEITVTDRYGSKEESYTIRNKIASLIAGQLVYKKSNYSSERNAFTGAIDELVNRELKKFQTEFNSMVTKDLLKLCLDEATTKLKLACGVK